MPYRVRIVDANTPKPYLARVSDGRIFYDGCLGEEYPRGHENFYVFLRRFVLDKGLRITEANPSSYYEDFALYGMFLSRAEYTELLLKHGDMMWVNVRPVEPDTIMRFRHFVRGPLEDFYDLRFGYNPY